MMCRHRISRPLTLLALWKQFGGAEVALESMWTQRAGQHQILEKPRFGALYQQRLPGRPLAPPDRFESVKRVEECLITCLDNVFLPGNHCPVLHSRIEGTNRPLAVPRAISASCSFFFTNRSLSDPNFPSRLT